MPNATFIMAFTMWREEWDSQDRGFPSQDKIPMFYVSIEAWGSLKIREREMNHRGRSGRSWHVATKLRWLSITEAPTKWECNQIPQCCPATMLEIIPLHVDVVGVIEPVDQMTILDPPSPGYCTLFSQSSLWYSEAATDLLKLSFPNQFQFYTDM